VRAVQLLRVSTLRGQKPAKRAAVHSQGCQPLGKAIHQYSWHSAPAGGGSKSAAAMIMASAAPSGARAEGLSEHAC
jgi:hypothetical protein